MRDYRDVDCDVAREALSARLDGEREHVPSARVDEHLDGCASCRAWFDQAEHQAGDLRQLVQSRLAVAPAGPVDVGPIPPLRRSWMTWQRWALLCVGLVQIALAMVQGLGLNVGLAHHHDHHGAESGNHLLNESTAWSIALGVIMVGAAIWPTAAAGLAGVLGVFVGVLAGFIVVDALSGAVTAARVLTHLPVLLGAVLAILVWRNNSAPRPAPQHDAADAGIVLPENASRGRRRGHLWPTDGSAA